LTSSINFKYGSFGYPSSFDILEGMDWWGHWRKIEDYDEDEPASVKKASYHYEA